MYNRNDGCGTVCTKRLGNEGKYTVSYRLRSTDAWTVCDEATAAADAIGPLLSGCLHLAQYIRVQLPGGYARMLNLAEVEVYSFPTGAI